MPRWVRVVTWFTLLVLCAYLYVAPRFINGQMVVLLDNGGTMEYRGATLRTHVEGRVLKFKTNEDGYWSVPVVSRVPYHGIHLQVYHEDAKAWFDVDLDGGTVWGASMGSKEIRLEVASNPPAVKQTILSERPLDRRIMNAFVRFAAGSEAWAQPAAAGQARSGMEQVAEKLNSIIARETRKDPEDITPTFRLTGKDAPSYSIKLSIINQAEKEFKVKLQDEEWRAMATSGDLAEYIYRERQKAH
jgi:acyl carrier protein